MESPCDETERSGDRVSLEAHLKDLRIDGLAESHTAEQLRDQLAETKESASRTLRVNRDA
jgi:hypothetical protein